MQIGVIWLGRRGAKISRRLMQARHSCVVWAANATTVQGLGKEGARVVGSLSEAMRAMKEKPRAEKVLSAMRFGLGHVEQRATQA